MALPHLIKHIYNYGSDEVIRRGKKIFSSGNIELMEYDQLLGSIAFRVKDDIYSMYYKVYVNKFKDPKTLSLRCSCPYNLGDICRHEAAALLQLQEMADRNELGNKENDYNQYHTAIKMKQLDLKTIRMFASHDSLINAEDYLRTNRASIVEAQEERVLVDVQYENAFFKVIIQKNEERNFDTSCDCNSEKEHPLCIHKTIVFLQLLNNYGPHYFDSIRNWDKEKNKLLALYGYSLEDDIEDKFEFTYKDGKPFLRVLDISIKRINGNASTIIPKLPSFAAPSSEYNEVIVQQALKLGIVIVSNADQYPYVQLDAIQGEPDDFNTDFVGKIEKLDLGKFINTEPLSEDDKLLIQQLRKLLPGEVGRYLNRNSPFYSNWENIIQHHDESLPEETRQLIIEYLYPKYQKIASSFVSNAFVYALPTGKPFQTANLTKINFSENYIKPEFWVNYTDGQYEIHCHAKLGNEHVSVADNEIETALFFKQSNTFYLWEKPEDVLLVEKFLPEGKKIIEAKNWKEKLQKFVLPLSKEYQVDFNNVKKEIIRDIIPDVNLLLRERNDYMLFQPVFTYYGYEIKDNDKAEVIVPVDDRLLIIHRHAEFEKKIVSKIASLHSSFIIPEDSQTLVLKGSEVLKNNWFFLFIDATREMNIPVHGFDKLKNFKFNTAKPSMRLFISTETDWFDAKVEIDFGGQKINVADVKKALSSKQQYVTLGDGTLGILPEEWIEKYSLLFRVGEANGNDKLKVNKYHFNLIEDLYENRDEENVVFELEEKYSRLRNFENIKSIDVPEHLAPILRPYQTSGFHWLNYLNEVQWGGILADDMGLGKTIQALSFLHHIKHDSGSLKALVVCPTTLMYNWENEITKFTPSISYYIHHGGSRTKDLLKNANIEVVITTYGTLRSDIKNFLEVTFDYVILDESQAIKNPLSKVTKAASLIKAKNRLCLSGTPLQNNTFDIYAQMNFLNPGMLGSIEFFKQEFAFPIDKYGEKYPKDHLRKLLYPFILRRTKEQVAKDLPTKSEMILFCEMSTEQRDIYDAYRNDFRDRILGIVEAQGIQRSQLTILQGLMKLRQICDSPAILKDEDYPNVSVKLDELGREIAENISNHKALVFSQFLGMLALIKEKLDELGIAYEYFDGSTTAIDRKKAIQNFQDDDSCRVFLISLKAGGVGLNLTAADYVYIVDPWWNPAVEQQAIDRTHRIGQTKNIFAYRMICKDTVEDKILQLQEKKRALAADLITDDSGFIKTLTKDDVEYLFS